MNENTRQAQRDALAIRFFEILITTGKADYREPRQAARCAKHCADVMLDVLMDKKEQDKEI